MTKWEYATVDYNTATATVETIAYGPESPLKWDVKRNAAFVRAKKKSLLAVLDLMGTFGWEIVSGCSVTSDTGGERFILKRQALTPAPTRQTCERNARNGGNAERKAKRLLPET
jgi:hypothetical protein